MGDIATLLLPATALGLSAIKHDGPGFIQYGKSAAVATGATYALKQVVDAERPDGGEHSFPSMHTSFSFAAAEFLRKRYGWKYGAPAYTAAAFVGYTRVESDNHYWRDVIAGAGIGIASGYFFTEALPELGVVPMVSGNYLGVQMNGGW